MSSDHSTANETLFPHPDSSIYKIIPLPELFNRLDGLSSFGATVIYDLRPSEEYYLCHLPGSTNLPVSVEDVRNHVTIEQLASRFSGMEARSFKNARARKLVIIINEEFNENDCIASNSTASYIANLFFEEKKVRDKGIMVLNYGFKAFHERYPFITCSYSEKEISGKKHIHKKTVPWYPSEVLEQFLFLGNHVDASNKTCLSDLGITHIVNVSEEVPNHFPDQFTYLKFSLPDEESEDLVQHFNEAFAFLDNALANKQKCLVHCHQGISRSATIVLAYIMKLKRYTLKQTYDQVKNLRPKVLPNLGFWYQLAHFEETLFEGQCTIDECVDIQMMLEEKAEREEVFQKPSFSYFSQAMRKEREAQEKAKEESKSAGDSVTNDEEEDNSEEMGVGEVVVTVGLDLSSPTLNPSSTPSTPSKRISLVEQAKHDLHESSMRILKDISITNAQKRRNELREIFLDEGRKGRILAIKQKLAKAGIIDSSSKSSETESN